MLPVALPPLQKHQVLFTTRIHCKPPSAAAEFHFLRGIEEQLSLPLPDLPQSHRLEKARLCRKVH